ncbi:sepiapterin reductase-like [Anneissia japonica]|uniref:sepiapterin reductase-like n=1 Tax=Anneissia japonica TaxID=1529436 RepID=UPI001425B9E8|nr:sepiapterin reductase-like [Anneissia japonica]
MDSSKTGVFCVPVFCIITGASRGIGRAIAVQLSQKVGEKSQMVITARNTQCLAETKRLIECVSPAVSVKIVAGDLGNSADLKTLIGSIFNDVEPAGFQHAVLVHNAGTLGDISQKICEISDAEQLQKCNFENVTSAHLITARFLTVFTNFQCRRRTVVQISSLAAVKPFATWSMYCVAKAARDMLFGVLAQEDTSVRVLSYAPGPINTDMLHKIATETGDDSVRNMMMKLFKEGNAVKVEDTVAKLLTILERDEFISGAHIDYYD